MVRGASKVISSACSGSCSSSFGSGLVRFAASSTGRKDEEAAKASAMFSCSLEATREGTKLGSSDATWFLMVLLFWEETPVLALNEEEGAMSKGAPLRGGFIIAGDAGGESESVVDMAATASLAMSPSRTCEGARTHAAAKAQRAVGLCAGSLARRDFKKERRLPEHEANLLD
mmetsp:Transcript_3206/g.7539  ORF Transcript_3206/g.7539 Transcript_3206/m.7539 type:complete len:173 (-) Transcript_3206:1297-1815(-)